MRGFKFMIFFILNMFVCITCHNNSNRSKEVKDIFTLIEYPAEYDTIIDCSKFRPDWKPYPCLELDNKTFSEIKLIYGEPNTILVDTLLYGKRKDGGTYFPDIEEMLFKIPYAKITYAYWKLSEYKRLALYFIENNKQDVIFYGCQFNPWTIMME